MKVTEVGALIRKLQKVSGITVFWHCKIASFSSDITTSDMEDYEYSLSMVTREQTVVNDKSFKNFSKAVSYIKSLIAEYETLKEELT